MKDATVVLVQHAQKAGGGGDPGLTATGRRQAARAAHALAGMGVPAAVWSSPLRRAAQTAGVIASRFHVAVHHDERLRERINWAGPGVQTFESFLADWRRTAGDAAGRMREAIEELAGLGGLVVAVTHGGATADLLHALFGGEPLEDIPPCTFTVLTRAGGAWGRG